MTLQHLYHTTQDTAGGRLGTVRTAATWVRSNGRPQSRHGSPSGTISTAERQEQRAARRIGPGGSRPLNAIDRSLRRCRLGKVFLSDVPWLSGD